MEYRMMNRYQLVSVFFHVVVFLFGIMLLQPLMPPQQLGEPQIVVIQAYMQTSELTQSVSKVVEKIAAKIEPITKSISRTTAARSDNKSIQVAVEQQTHGEQVDELLRMMHRAIQQAQQYPSSAQAMGREGRVTVAFKLLMSGEVADVVLRQSSGVNSLDQAAIAAVKDAAPFHGVDRYLSAPRSFAIDVVFSISR
jgi:TonB family protein